MCWKILQNEHQHFAVVCFFARNTVRYFPLRKLLVQCISILDYTPTDFSPQQTHFQENDIWRYMFSANMTCWFILLMQQRCLRATTEEGPISDEHSVWKKSRNREAPSLKAKSFQLISNHKVLTRTCKPQGWELSVKHLERIRTRSECCLVLASSTKITREKKMVLNYLY